MENIFFKKQLDSQDKFKDKEEYQDKAKLEDFEYARKHEMWELQQMQGLPLSTKILLTQSRIRDWVDYYGLNHVTVSVSGGKDSTVLAHIARQMYPDISLLYVNTGLEYSECTKFVKDEYSGGGRLTMLRPFMTFKEVLTKYGYPIFGKEISGSVSRARNNLRRKTSDKNIYRYFDYLINNRHYSDLQPDILDYCEKVLCGDVFVNENMNSLIGKSKSSFFNRKRYKFMLGAPFEISELCCNIMKKSVLIREEHVSKKYPITGEMASESLLRTQKWLRVGCNGFNLNHPKSMPLAFWTEQDILLYLLAYKVNYCSIYGDIISDKEILDLDREMHLDLLNKDRAFLSTTNVDRTGCLYCGFGIQLDNDRLVRLGECGKQKELDYILRGGNFVDGLWKPDNRGLGMWFPYAYINKYSNIDIAIPNLEKYINEYGTLETKEFLQ